MFELENRRYIGSKAELANWILNIIQEQCAGEIFVDTTYKAAGRGAYICKNIECIESAEKKNALSRAFKMNVDGGIYEQIRKNTN